MTQDTPAWVQTQHNAFLRWCNMHLKSIDEEPLQDLSRDFSNGVLLIRLLEAVTKQSLGKFHRAPKKMQAYENINIALDFIRHQNIVINSIGDADIAEGNLKLILGLLWMIILKFAIADISEEGLTAKEGLLLWCKRKTAGYENVDVRDFGSSWKSGLALCALLDRYRPDLMDYSKLDFSKPEENIRTAIEIASNEVGIPQLVEVEDIRNALDEKSLVTYLAYWFHAFNELDNIETAGRRVGKFHDIFSTALHLRREYERRAQHLVAEIENTMERWEAVDLTNYLIVKSEHEQILRYKNHDKRRWIAEKTELLNLLGNVRIKLNTYGFRSYDPPAGLDLLSINAIWKRLLDAELSYTREVGAKLREFKDVARKEFADLANGISESLNALSLSISDLDGELESQLLSITGTSESLVPLMNDLEKLQGADEMCRDLELDENDYTIYTFDELQYELEMVKEAVANKLLFVENQMAARTVTNVTPDLLDEFETVFRHFDKGQHNCLYENEFAAAIASLGITYSPEEMQEVFDTVSKGEGKIGFRDFIVFMVTVTEDRQSPDQVLSSFREISSGKSIVTRTDLENALLPDDLIDSLLEAMPSKDGGYDYEAYVDEILAS